MALGSSWTTIGQGSQTINGATLTYYIEAKLNSQSIANNTSSISTRARTVFSGYYMQSYGYYFSCTGCTTSQGTGLYSFTTETVLTGSTTVTHNADGTKTFSMSGLCKGSGIGLSISASGSIALPTIPRASQCTASPNPITLSSQTNTLTVTTNRASNSFTHTITVTAGSWSDTQTSVGASTTFAIPYSVVGDMTASTMTCQIACTTYNGSTTIGSSSSSFVVKVDSSIEKAYVSSVTLSDTNATASALETSGKFIYGQSNLSAVVAFATAGTYTTLKSYTISYDGTSQTDDLSGTSGSATFTKSGVTSATMTITVTDNRNTITTYTQTVTLIDYRSVGFAEVSVYRVNSSDQPTETGDYIHYEIKVNCFDGSFGQGGNPITLGYKYKLASASTYGTEATIDTHTGTSAGEYTTYTFSGVTGGGNLLYSNEYDIVFTISDTFTSASSTVQRLHQGIPVYAWGEDHFDVYGAVHIHDRSDVTKYIALGALNPHTETVTFSGADGGSVNWLVFDYGALTICVAKWRCAENKTVSSAWGSMYTCTRFATPSYPVNYTAVYYQNMQMIQADQNANGSAIVVPQIGYAQNLADFGEVYLARGTSATIGHPIFVQIVVGTR